MSYNNGPKVVTSGLRILLDPANRKYTNGTTVLYNAVGNNIFSQISYAFGSSSWGSVQQNGTVFFSGSKANNNVEGNYLYVACQMSNTIDNADFTTAAWVYRLDSTKATICEYRGTGTRLEFSVDNSSAYFNQRLLASPFTTFTTSAATTNQQNVWNHFTLARTGTSWSFYKDGALLATNTFSQPEAMGNGNSVSIGIAWSDDDYASSCMVGYIGHWMHYGRCLSASEVRENYEATKGRYRL